MVNGAKQPLSELESAALRGFEMTGDGKSRRGSRLSKTWVDICQQPLPQASPPTPRRTKQRNTSKFPPPTPCGFISGNYASCIRREFCGIQPETGILMDDANSEEIGCEKARRRGSERPNSRTRLYVCLRADSKRSLCRRLVYRRRADLISDKRPPYARTRGVSSTGGRKIHRSFAPTRRARPSSYYFRTY